MKRLIQRKSLFSSIQLVPPYLFFLSVFFFFFFFSQIDVRNLSKMGRGRTILINLYRLYHSKTFRFLFTAIRMWSGVLTYNFLAEISMHLRWLSCILQLQNIYLLGYPRKFIQLWELATVKTNCILIEISC